MKDTGFCCDRKIEMDKVDVVRSRLKNLGLFWNGIPISIVEPLEEEVRVLDDDQGLDDHGLEELFHETFFDLKGNILYLYIRYFLLH